MTVNVSGLNAWRNGDSLQLVSPHSGVVLAGLENDLASAPRDGETSLAGPAINWKNTFAPLVDASRGDRVMLTQLVTSSSNGRTYRAVARAGVAEGFSLRDGQPASLSATLTALKQEQTLALRWKGSAFAALTAQVGPDAQPAGAATVAIKALTSSMVEDKILSPGSDELPNLVTFSPLPGEDVEQSVTWANPFPSLGGAWHELATVTYSASVPVPTQWGVGSVAAHLITAVPVASLRKSGELTPQLSPVQGVVVDVAGDKISWKAPAIGKSDGYSVSISSVKGDDQGVKIESVSLSFTAKTSMALPGLLPGTYVAKIIATSRGEGEAFASAEYVTAQFTR